MQTRDQARMASVAYVYQKANRILSGQMVRCEFSNEQEAPAWSAGSRVYFNERLVQDTYTQDGMVSFTGVNYHELCHVMYTPTFDHPLAQWVAMNGLNQAFNILEDQRIETLMTASYRSTSAYFTSMFLKHCVSNQSARVLSMAHTLSYGRRYLPRKLRVGLRALFVDAQSEDVAKIIESLIDRYRALIFDNEGLNVNEAATVIAEFAALLQGSVQPPNDPYGHQKEERGVQYTAESDTNRDQRTKNQEQGKKDREKADDAGDDAYPQFDPDADDNTDTSDGTDGSAGDESDDDTNDADVDGSGEGEDGDESDDESQDGQAGSGDASDGDADGEEPDEESDSDSDDDTDTTGKGGNGASGGESQQPPAPADVRSQARDLDEAIKQSEQVQSDVADWQETIRKSAGKVLYGQQQPYAEVEAEPQYKHASRMFAKSLQKLWADADPGWDRYQNSGRLSVKRAMQGGELDTVWDRWDAGQNDVTDIELVLLVDVSGSMEHSMIAASQASWAIKRAVEQVRGKVTVVGYETGHHIHYQKHERASALNYRLFGSIGGTRPKESLTQAQVMFERSKASHKILITITDGGWQGDRAGSEEIIRNLGKRGVITAIGHLGYRTSDWHDCQLQASFNDPMGIVDLARKVVTTALRPVGARGR